MIDAPNKYPETVIKDVVSKVDLLEYIERHIELEKQSSGYFGICPFHNEEDASFYVKPEENFFYCFGCGAGGDIINFVKKYHKLSFTKAVEYLIEYTNYEIDEEIKECKTLIFLKKFQPAKELKSVDRQILPNDIMDNYIKKPIKEWLSEGITQAVLDDYSVRYDTLQNKIVFPVYDNEGNIINIKGRTLYDEWKELKIPKYIYYYKLGTNDMLFGLYKKYDIIQDYKSVILFESEKSVMKLDSFGVFNSVALATNRINEYQIKKLLELKVDIILAMDKGIIKKDILKQCETLKRFTNVYYIYDNTNLLKDKQSPIDEGFSVWNELYNSKIRV